LIARLAAAPVVKLQSYSACSELPAVSLATVEMAASYCVPYASGAEGVKVAVAPDTATVPVIAAPPWTWTVKTLPVMLAGDIGLLKVTLMVVPGETPAASFAGTVERTVGTVWSRALPVVNDDENAGAMPVRALAVGTAAPAGEVSGVACV